MKLFLTPVLTFSLLAGACLCLPALAQDSLLNSGSSKLPIVRSTVLPADEAFALNTLVEAPDTVVLFWEIKEGYYLYRKSIAVIDKNKQQISLVQLPDAKTINDEFFGEVSVYYDRLLIRFPLSLLDMENKELTFTLQYQGCAEDLYCYPLQIKPVTLTLP